MKSSNESRENESQKSHGRLIIKDSFDKEIKPFIDTRINLMVHSVYGAFMGSGEPDQTTFLSVLSRIIILVQRQLTFVVFERIGKDYKEAFRTDRYTKDKSKIDAQVDDVLNGNTLCHLFPIFSKLTEEKKESCKYYLLALSVRKGRSEIPDDPKYKTLPLRHLFEIVRRDHNKEFRSVLDIVSYQLEKILSVDSYLSVSNEDRASKLIDIMNNSVRLAADLYKQEAGRGGDENATDANESFKREEKEFMRFKKYLLKNKTMNYFELNGYGYLDTIFKKIKKNLTHLMRFYVGNTVDGDVEEKPTNYLLLTRDYIGGTINRFAGNFHYQTRFAICDTQKKEIKSQFSKLKNDSDKQKGSYPNSLRPYYKTASKDEMKEIIDEAKKYQYHKYICKIAVELDDWFWNELLTSDNAIEYFLLEVLEYPFGEGARGAADLVFINQIPQIITPYDDGGIPRCFPNTADETEFKRVLADIKNGGLQNKDSYIDLKRLVVTYYWYKGMLDEVDDKDKYTMQLVLLPVELGGKVWCVQGYFLPILKTEKIEEYFDLELSERSWYQVYHLVNDVNSRIKKEIRYNLEECYMNHLSEVYVSQLTDEFKLEVAKKYISQGGDEGKLTLPAVHEEVLNSKLNSLTKIYPFEGVKLKMYRGFGVPDENVRSESQINPNDSTNYEVGVYLTDEVYYELKIEPNKYFDTSKLTSLRDYIKALDVRVRLSQDIKDKHFIIGRAVSEKERGGAVEDTIVH